MKWSNDGKHFCSGSKDGSVKIWDGVSNRCIATFLQAHDGAEVCSVAFSRNGKYVLSSGKVRQNVRKLGCHYVLQPKYPFV